VLALLGPGDFLGEGCIIGNPVRVAAATARAPLEATLIEKKEIMRVLQDEQEFAGKFIRYMLERNIKIEADLVDQLFHSSEKRLARALLILARYGKHGEPETMAKMSQETLAELVGTTRSRVNFFMNKFRKLGFIHYKGGLQVHSSLLNVVLHDEPRLLTFCRASRSPAEIERCKNLSNTEISQLLLFFLLFSPELRPARLRRLRNPRPRCR
jgi:CRP/FNR family transcriptional regulator, cyclic AMP receptor protein